LKVNCYVIQGIILYWNTTDSAVEVYSFVLWVKMKTNNWFGYHVALVFQWNRENPFLNLSFWSVLSLVKM